MTNNSETKVFIPRPVLIGNIPLGGKNIIRLQSMTNTDTLDTKATVAQCIRIYEAGADFVRITAPGMNEARNLENIKKEIKKQGYDFPLIADVHFNPDIAEYCARIVEKIRINPGNYTDKKRNGIVEFSETDYNAELERISTRIHPLLKICKEYGTALRIGSNHGSLSDRIMFRFGDTPQGMAESAMEFLRICNHFSFRNIVVSMKASNIRIMVQATRILVQKMMEENLCFPIHLGVTEAGESEDGRIKSAIGIGALLADGIGDTIRVSLTEAPEKEIPVAKKIVKQFSPREKFSTRFLLSGNLFNPIVFNKRLSDSVNIIGGKNQPIVISDCSCSTFVNSKSEVDFHYLGQQKIDFKKYKNTKFISDFTVWTENNNSENVFPFFTKNQYLTTIQKSNIYNFIQISSIEKDIDFFETIRLDKTAVLLLQDDTIENCRYFFNYLKTIHCSTPVIICKTQGNLSASSLLIESSCLLGSLLNDGLGDGIFINRNEKTSKKSIQNLAFGILQATQTRISKTDFISCPTCGRTQFDITSVLTEIKKKTSHLKGLKIAVMGCVVNGPGEMADANYGLVGAGSGKVNLYKGKELIRKNILTENAVEEMINLIKENNQWFEEKK